MKKCDKCNKDNREEAIFCRFCGEKLPVIEEITISKGGRRKIKRDKKDHLDGIIGLDQKKEQIREFITIILALMKQRGKSVLNTLNSNILITGPTGSGKTNFMDTVAAYILNKGIVKLEESNFFTSLSIDNLNLSENPLQMFTLDDADKLLPSDGSDDLLGTPLHYVFANMRNRLADTDDKLIVIMSGGPEMASFVERNPEIKNLFAKHIKLEELTPLEVADITEAMLLEHFKLPLTQEAYDKLVRVINYERRNTEKFGNAHLASSKANDIVMKSTIRCKGKTPKEALPDDIDGKEYVPKTLEEVMGEFDKFVGVDEIKKTMTGIVDSIKSFQKLHPDKTYELKDHYLFLGNPGTGKTTMARVFADALSAMGILASGQLIEVAPKDLRGQYVGHTGPMVDAAFDKAMGGILFIDEAYNMWNGSDDQFGNEAVTVMLKNMEDRKGKLVVILAGYPREMDYFIENANPGLSSRFNETIDFRDYKGPELTEIARRMIKSQGYTLDEKADKMIDKFFEKMYVSRKKDFGNARDVRNVVDKAIKAQNSRVQKATKEGGFDKTQEFVITMADINGNEKQAKTVDEVIASMDDLIGMADIKKEIRKLANVAMVNRMRMERGLGAAALQPVNIILTGNPGTGKTTIAKRLGEVLHAAGVLPTDKVIEREAKTILSSYVNASGQNMDKAVDEAMGGVLFIDEVYNLLPQPGSMNNTGNEALDALMTRMENDKGKFVVVIAGYKDRMEDLIRRGNPGLMSRFNKNFHIDDYDADSLFKIFMMNAKKRKFNLTPDAENAVKIYIEDMIANKRQHFGNAREVVNLLNEVVELQGNRIASDPSVIDSDPEALTTIEEADIPKFD